MWCLPRSNRLHLFTSLAPAWSILVFERWKLDGNHGHQRSAIALVISNSYSRSGRYQYGYLALVCVHHPAGCGSLRCDDVHIHVEGNLTQRRHLEGQKLSIKLACEVGELSIAFIVFSIRRTNEKDNSYSAGFCACGVFDGWKRVFAKPKKVE